MITLLMVLWWMPNGDILPSDLGESRDIYRQEQFEPLLPQLRERFGRYKSIPPQYELPALLALAHYPDLVDARIEFVIKNDGAPIASWPVIHTLFYPKGKRRYRIFISESSRWGDSPALVRNMSFNAQVGALGHELSHTAQFHQKNLFQMVGIGFCFISKKFHRNFELNTDRRAIDHGLGHQLYDWSLELRGGRVKDNPDYWLDRYYLSPERIQDYMEGQSAE